MDTTCFLTLLTFIVALQSRLGCQLVVRHLYRPCPQVCQFPGGAELQGPARWHNP
jgi:hypothetical protein